MSTPNGASGEVSAHILGRCIAADALRAAVAKMERDAETFDRVALGGGMTARARACARNSAAGVRLAIEHISALLVPNTGTGADGEADQAPGDVGVSLITANEELAAERDRLRAALEEIRGLTQPLPYAVRAILYEALR
jgi:hypothetical protein